MRMIIIVYYYGVHLSNDTLSIAFENTMFSLIRKQNATVSIGSVLKWHARSHISSELTMPAYPVNPVFPQDNNLPINL
jgi:hypothetical protein